MTTRWRKYYLLYVTRNGQHIWEGPFTSKRRTTGRLRMLLDAQDPIIICPGTTIWPTGRRSTRDEAT